MQDTRPALPLLSEQRLDLCTAQRQRQQQIIERLAGEKLAKADVTAAVFADLGTRRLGW
jgi:hypothetical protein